MKLFNWLFKSKLKDCNKPLSLQEGKEYITDCGLKVTNVKRRNVEPCQSHKFTCTIHHKNKSCDYYYTEDGFFFSSKQMDIWNIKEEVK